MHVQGTGVVGNCQKNTKNRIISSLISEKDYRLTLSATLASDTKIDARKHFLFISFIQRSSVLRNKDYCLEMAAFHPSCPTKLYEYKVNIICLSFPSYFSFHGFLLSFLYSSFQVVCFL